MRCRQQHLFKKKMFSEASRLEMYNLSPKGERQGQELASAFSLQLVRLSPVFAVLNVAENKDSPITSVVKS